MIKLGLRLPQRTGDLRRDVAEVARSAEKLGYASLWTYERLLFPDAPTESYFGSPWPEEYRRTADPLAVLTVAAMVTSRARLGTSALVAATHAPVQYRGPRAVIAPATVRPKPASPIPIMLAGDAAGDRSSWSGT